MLVVPAPRDRDTLQGFFSLAFDPRHKIRDNLATFLRCIKLPEEMADWSLTSLQLKLIRIGARVVRHARAITFQLAEVAVTGAMVRAILGSHPPARERHRNARDRDPNSN